MQGIRQSKRENIRQSSGFAFGTLTSLIAVPVVCIISCLLIDIGLCSYYQQKVRFVLKQVAEAAINLSDETDVHDYVQRLATGLTRKSGIPSSLLLTSVESRTVDDEESSEITLEGFFPLIPNTNLPPIIHIKETKVLTRAVNRRFAELSSYAFPLANLYPDRGPSVYTPILRPKRGMPVWSFRSDQTLSSVSLIDGEAPRVPLIMDLESYFRGRESLY